MSIQLKIKAKHLAAESAIIRKEEMKIKARLRHQRKLRKAAAKAKQAAPVESPYREQNITTLKSLSSHRREIVRGVARSTHLARGFLKGTPYVAMENENTRSQPCWNAVEKMITKYSPEDSRLVKQRFERWKTERLAA